MLKNLKSLFIVEDEESSKKKGETPQPVAVPSSVPLAKESSAGEPGKVSDKFTEVLFSAMERDNQEGFDYLEFKQSLKSLEKMPMDEATRYQSALAMARTLGADPARLLQSAAHYVNVLKQESNKFETALGKQQEEKIGQKIQQQQTLKNTIQEKEATIKKLMAEIEAHRTQAAQLQDEVEKASKKVESTKNDFIASYNALVSQIQLDIDNMKKFLQ